MRLTVAICTWNRCALLRQTLDQLTRVSVPEGVSVDFLVINNNCTDDTDAVISEFLHRLPLARVFEPKPGVVHLRNAALSSSTADVVAFVDDDALADPSWLTELATAARLFPEATAIGGIIEPWFIEEPDREYLEAFPHLKHGFCAVDHNRAPGPLPGDLHVFGPNMAYRMAAMGDLRFDPAFGGTPTSAMGGDEPDLLRRIRSNGGTVVWWPNMRVRHCVDPSRMTHEYLLKFAVEKGKELVLFSARPAPAASPVPGWLTRQYVGVFFRYLLSYVTRAELLAYPRPFSGPIETHSSRRVRTLCWRREIAFIYGMIQGYRQLVQA